MFTGLIEEVGVILTMSGASEQGRRFTIGAATVLDGVQLGDSIAVNGACMTVVAFDECSFAFEASPESLAKTTLSTAQVGQRVNLERPLTPVSRIGGHYVTGHVDGLAKIVSRDVDGNSIIFTFEVGSSDLAELLIPKGSVTILGISLTVNTVNGRHFSVAIIPHTLSHTNLNDYHPGDTVNIETDLLGKYVRRLLFERTVPQAATDETEEHAYTSFSDGASAVLTEGVAIDVGTLASAANAIRTTQAFSASQVRTGGWFNFEHEPGAS